MSSKSGPDDLDLAVPFVMLLLSIGQYYHNAPRPQTNKQAEQTPITLTGSPFIPAGTCPDPMPGGHQASGPLGCIEVQIAALSWGNTSSSLPRGQLIAAYGKPLSRGSCSLQHTSSAAVRDMQRTQSWDPCPRAFGLSLASSQAHNA